MHRFSLEDELPWFPGKSIFRDMKKVSDIMYLCLNCCIIIAQEKNYNTVVHM